MTHPALPLVYRLPPGVGPTTLPRLGRVTPGQHFSPTPDEAERWHRLKLIVPVVPHKPHLHAGGPYAERAPLAAHEEVPHAHSPERLDYPEADPVPPVHGIPIAGVSEDSQVDDTADAEPQLVQGDTAGSNEAEEAVEEELEEELEEEPEEVTDVEEEPDAEEEPAASAAPEAPAAPAAVPAAPMAAAKPLSPKAQAKKERAAKKGQS